MIERIIVLVAILGIIAGCGWIAMQAIQVYHEATVVAQEIQVAQAQTVNARAQATAVILDAQGGYNYNNAQATAVIVDSKGQYAVNVAEATAIVANSNHGPINAFKDGQTQGVGAGFGLSFMGVMLVAVLILVGVLVIRK